MMIKIVLADDHKLFRDGLRYLLEKHPDMTVVGEAADGLQTVKMAGELDPDVILMDISMPGLNGIDASKKILKANPNIKIIILSMHADRRYVAESLRSGVKGYLLKDSAIEEVLSVIAAVIRDEIYLSRKIKDIVIQDYIKIAGSPGESVYKILSSREREVLQLVAEGKPTKEIASLLNVSTKTIETHRKQIMDKLDLHSIAELTKYAIREGLTQLE